MKKFYMFFAALVASFSMIASAQDTPTLMWANNFYYQNGADKITNIGYNITMASDGNLLVFNDCGTTTADTEVYFGEDLVGMGTEYNSTSYNHGVFLVKADANTGKALWSVYSNVGEGSSNQGAVAATSDGGAFMVVKMRHTVNRCTDKINFVDATGANTTIDWVLDSASAKRYYNAIILKVNGEGAIQWYRMITMNHDPQPNASKTYSTYTPEGIYVQTAITDPQDNLYVGGRFCTAMTFDNGVTLTPQSVAEDWTGDPQKANGDLFIAKFDAEGNYVNSLVQDGKGDAGQIFKLNFRGGDGNIYAVGYFDGIEGNDVTLGGKQLTPGNVGKDLLAACIDTDLNVKWARLFTTTYSGSTFNKLSINAIGDNVWITGKVRTTLDDGEGNTFDCSGKTRDGLLLHLNSADGSWVGATNYGTNQAGFNGAFENTNDPDHVYVYGHVLFGYLFVAKYSVADLTLQEQWDLHSSASDLQNYTAVCYDNRLYTMARIASGNVTVNYADTEEGTYTFNNPVNFATLVCAFTLPGTISTAIQEVEQAQTRVFGAEGNLHIVAQQPTTVRVYSITGAQVATINAQQGDNTIALPAGIYIAGGNKVVVR